MLATFGLILFFNDLVRAIWGPAGKSIAVPAFLNHTVEILPGVPYPAYRFALIVAGLDRKSTRLNSSHSQQSRMPSSA